MRFHITFALLLVGIVIFAIKNEIDTKNYITDHKCKVTRTKLRDTYTTTTTSNGGVVTVPTVTTDHLYECEIAGDRGKSFWK